jgi:hypothetical protein
MVSASSSSSVGGSASSIDRTSAATEMFTVGSAL